MPSKDSEIIHANCVSFDGKGLLILGASGVGKSSLTFEMIALGATLVSDDRTCLRVVGQSLWAEAPEAIRGIIEARGVGILASPSLQGERISAAVDLDRIEDQRLPPLREIALMGQTIPCLRKVENPSFSAILLHYLRYGMQSGV